MTSMAAQTAPGLGSLYLRALTRRRKSATLTPKLSGSYTLENPSTDLARYRAFYGLPGTAPVPISYFFVLGTRPQLTLLTDRDCPAPAALGLVQTGLTVTRHSDAPTISGAVVAECSVDMGQGPILTAHVALATDRGQKLADIEARFFDRSRKTAKSGPRAPQPDAQNLPSVTQGEVVFEPGRGRRYAKVSGDWNPIHLSLLSAKLFGLKRPIVHGLDSVATALGRLEAQSSGRLDVQFLKPVFIPSKAMLRYDRSDTGLEFSLTNGAGDREYLKGSVA